MVPRYCRELFKVTCKLQRTFSYKDIPNGQKSETRLWHRDGEDFKLLKIVVYLNNVSKKKATINDNSKIECSSEKNIKKQRSKDAR